MLKKYKYDLVNEIAKGQLFKEIEKSTITKKIFSVEIDDDEDDIIISFETELDGSEVITLNNLVQNHKPITGINKDNIYFQRTETNSLVYELVVCYIYQGSNETNTITGLTFEGYKDENVSDYNVRLYDPKRNLVLGEITCSNNETDEIDILSITNVQTEQTCLEIHIKKNGGTGLAHISSACIHI